MKFRLILVTLFSFFIALNNLIATVNLNIMNNSGKTLYYSIKCSSDDTWWSFKNSDWETPDWEKHSEDYSHTSAPAEKKPISYIPKAARFFVAKDVAITSTPTDNDTIHLYDKIETGLPGAVWDLTNVDFIAIPMQLSVGSKTVGYNSDITRENLFEKLSDLSGGYSVPIASSLDSSTILRYNAPYKLANITADLSNAIDSTVNNLTKNYTSGNKYVTYGGFFFSNFTAEQGTKGKGWDITATCINTTNNNSYQKSTVTITGLNNQSVLACSVGNDGSAGGGKLAALIAAAINRGVGYAPDKLWGENAPPNNGFPASYYHENSSNSNEVNLYAKTLHDYSINGTCYGIAYDDIYSQSTSVTVKSDDNVTITILPFTGSTSPKPNTYPATPASNPKPPLPLGKYYLGLGLASDQGKSPTYPFNGSSYILANGVQIDATSGGLYAKTNPITIKFSNSTAAPFKVDTTTGIITPAKPFNGQVTASKNPSPIPGSTLAFPPDFNPNAVPLAPGKYLLGIPSTLGTATVDNISYDSSVGFNTSTPSIAFTKYKNHTLEVNFKKPGKITNMSQWNYAQNCNFVTVGKQYQLNLPANLSPKTD